MKVKVLIENSPSPTDPDIKSEHGLSMYIEYGNSRYLLDVGATGRWANNAEILGVDIENIDYLMLSHGHIDHTGGLSAFFDNNTKATVIASSKIADYHYSSYRHAGKVHDLTPDVQTLYRFTDRMHYIDSNCRIADNVNLVFNKASSYAVPCGNKYLRVSKSDNIPHKYTADDEIALAISTSSGLVIISSCSHSGMLNIIESCRAYTGVRNVIAYIGGLHLVDSDTAENLDNVEGISGTIKEKYPDMKLYAGHCTGNHAKQILSSELGDKYITIYSGKEIEL